MYTWIESTLASSKVKLALNLDTSLLEAEEMLERPELTLVIVAWALFSAKFATVRLELAAAIDWFADEIASLALCCTLANAEVALVATKFATVTLEKAATVATLALRTTTSMVEEAEFWADLIPLEAEMEACWSCWEKVAFKAMIVLEISTVARLTEAAMRFEQSWGLFCRSSRGAGAVVISAFWGCVVLDVVDNNDNDDDADTVTLWLSSSRSLTLEIIRLRSEGSSFKESSTWIWPAIKKRNRSTHA